MLHEGAAKLRVCMSVERVRVMCTEERIECREQSLGTVVAQSKAGRVCMSVRTCAVSDSLRNTSMSLRCDVVASLSCSHGGALKLNVRMSP